ncbi:general secretion pathway protein L [Psychromonas ingrahamii 37]|uniref:Type II secretion system protein L n=1 Tax=Psychromonas ingrahamii (strain DSM 17664 / CCUG 51855 / 37) TaxID=357804 RepID=A1SR64_PSYIN|nr:type II secretion system protein GspL [Psychromonas ingrahamii]ABM01979.1 general secretion pathway protein L [Psychromonas ingrahamii 37]
MNERLIIRLASSASQKNYWLIWSDSENEIIASGEVDNAEQLSLLTEKAFQRRVICLLPGVDICIKKVVIKGAFNRQMQQALPYLVEEELASDVEKLHFNVIAKETHLVHVAICDKQKMYDWIDWLEKAQINCKQFIPEGLTLPLPEDGKWQAIKLGEQWLIRETANIAWSCDHSMLNTILESKLKNSADEDLVPRIESYSPVIEDSVAEWSSHDAMLPMELLAIGTKNNPVNFLTAEFKPVKEVSPYIKKWRIPAAAGVLLFIVSVLNIYSHTLQVQAETELIQQQVETIYSQAFPRESKLRYARINYKLDTMLKELQGSSVEFDFLTVLDDLSPALMSLKEFEISSLKFDSKKQELQLALTAPSFQAFETFAAELPEHLSAQQGALNNSKSGVSGVLTIRKK